MKIKWKNILAFTSLVSITLVTANFAWSDSSSNDIFIIKTTSKSMTDVVSSIKKYSKEKKWVYLGDNKVKKGTVILVKICIKQAGKIAFKAGLKISALVPCGNVGVYKKGKLTEISLLNPQYMNILYPDPNLKAAADIAEPLFREMMKTIIK